MYNALKQAASRVWTIANTNLFSILIGGIVSHQLTKSYRDQEITELLDDVRNLQNDLKNRENDIKILSRSTDELRNNYVKQSSRISSSEFNELRCQHDLREYIWAYENTRWCVFNSYPRIPLGKHTNENNSDAPKNTPKLN